MTDNDDGTHGGAELPGTGGERSDQVQDGAVVNAIGTSESAREALQREEILQNSRWSGTPYIMPAATAVGLGVGWWLDDILGTSPWLAVCGLVSFLFIGLYLVIREVLRK